ncbi:MAG: hypothetical protein CVT84_05425 [Alphaproteobacteria bacterium HGW-Alphaproteobacteria-6]|nr:MAG: hypothetical protein CVT84_05425 [Alphaproteobacteria bacterium HGW-Alphaproteobacteria-6]
MADAARPLCATCGQASRVPAAGGAGEAPKCAARGDPQAIGRVTEPGPVAHDRLTRVDALALPGRRPGSWPSSAPRPGRRPEIFALCRRRHA